MVENPAPEKYYSKKNLKYYKILTIEKCFLKEPKKWKKNDNNEYFLLIFHKYCQLCLSV